MTLHFYLARRFLSHFALLFGAFFALALLTDATALLGQFGDKDMGVAETLRLALLKAPSGVYQMLSMIVILAALLMFRGLSRSSELVATRAAGVSALRTVAAPVSAAVLLGVFGLVAYNPLASTALAQFETETSRFQNGVVSTFSLSRQGLWLRQGSPTGQTVVFAARANYDATRLSEVTFFEFARDGKAQRRIEAASATLYDGAWHLGPGKVWSISVDDEVPDKQSQNFDSMKVGSNISSDQILESFGDPTTIPLWDLPAFIARLDRSGFTTSRHRTYFQIELSTPLLLAAMVILGAAFSMQHARKGGAGRKILFAVISGLAVYIIQDFAQILGSNGAVPVIAAAWGPPFAALLLALGLLLNLEEG